MSEFSKLKDVSQLITKGTTPTSVGGSFTDKGINFIKSESITGSKFLNNSVFAFIDDFTDLKLKRSRIKTNDLLFSIAGAYLGKISIVQECDVPANTNQAVGIVRVNKSLADVNYLYYYFSQNSVNEYINKLSSQSSQPNLNLELLGNLQFKNRKLETQQKIAAVLSALDDKIELNNQINAELEAMAKTLYDYWFVQFDFPVDLAQAPFDAVQGPASQNGTVAEEHATIGDRHAPVAERHAPVADGYSPEVDERTPLAEQPLPVAERSRTVAERSRTVAERSHTVAERSRGYKSSGGKMVYNEILKREIPEGWEVKKLHEIANITMGQSPSGESYNEKQEGMIFFQGSTDFGWRFPENRIYTTSPTRFAKENDILLSVRAPIGTMNIAMSDCCIGRGLSALNSKENYNSFLIYQMNYFKKKFDYLNSVGTTFGSLTKDDLYNLELCYPNKHILEKFEKIVSKFDAKIKINTKQNQELAQLRDWLLPMLMNGQVTVGEAEEKLGMVAEERTNYQKT